ncbi:MAG: hypothetical protein WBB47_14225 [Paenisporosarcina sp.]|uniref:hypothetical protein n=1 Tax=Paenisporosarcina sp. TaxID=1932001 RepID=UPI003C73BFD9
MWFEWNHFFGYLCVAIVFVLIKTFVDKEKDEKYFSITSLCEVLIFSGLFYITDLLFL